MINNFKQISELLKFTNKDDFYFLQIIQRKKDNRGVKGVNNNSRVVKAYYIKSIEYLLDKEEEIINICNIFNARAGINLNKRTFNKCALQTARLILDQIANKDQEHTMNAFNSVCGRFTSETDKKWILDIDDTKEVSPLMLAFINYECEPIFKMPDGSKIYCTIPTKSGIHVITKPFNLKTFKEKYPEIEVHKNNPTNLYIP